MISKIILFAVLILQLSTVCHCYVEALTANLDNELSHDQPMVAMLCGHGKFHNQYLNDQKQWVTDNDPTATCIKDKFDIFQYCQKVYPKKDITNIVESNHYYKIGNWKPVKSSKHHLIASEKQHYVKPIRCLEGRFQSDALLVPEHCVFDHIHNASVCEANTYWNKTANQSCKEKGKVLQSYAVLLPCGIGVFKGVEFVCCPASDSSSQNEISDRPIVNSSPEFRTSSRDQSETKNSERSSSKTSNRNSSNKKQMDKLQDQENNEDYNSSLEYEYDETQVKTNTANDQDIKYDDFEENKEKRPIGSIGKKVNSNKKSSKISNQQQDDDDDVEYNDDDDNDDDEDKENSIKSSSTSTTTTSTTTETPLEIYYSHFDSKNEHNLFKMAEESLRKIQLDKMKKIFKDYADFQTRLNEKKEKKSRKSNKKALRLAKQNDSELDENLRKKMEKRYEDALESLEIQNNEEKQQLNAMHQQRVLTLINMKKQEATDCYTSSLNQTPLKPRKIQKCLEKLMKSLEKDRIHTLHHYKHLLQVSSKLALKEKSATLTHLENLIVIANRSISMLHKYPSLNDKIRNHIIAFWHNLRGVPFNQAISRDTEQQIMEKYEEEIAQKQQEKERRKMMEEVKKEEKERLSESKKDENISLTQTTESHHKSTSASTATPVSTAASDNASDKNSGANKSSNIKYTARHSADSKMSKKISNNKQATGSQPHVQQTPQVSNLQQSNQHHESSFKISELLPEQHHLSGFKPFEQTRHAYVTFSIAGVAIFLAIISGIVLYRNSSSSSAHLSQGFVALQQQQINQNMNNSEQQQVEALQINGYENPTYKYFEKNVI